MNHPLLGRVVQLGFVVRNVDAAVARYEATVSLGPWTVYVLRPPLLRDRRYRGQPGKFAMKVAMATDASGLTYELIEPLAGPSIYHDFLFERGEGLHHIGCERTRSLDETVAAFRRAGVEVCMSGRWGKIDFAYLAAEEKLGVCVEVWDVPADYELPEEARAR
jgi:methylmalonyl-CoA/ethylmalonyl-CoA epimerase